LVKFYLILICSLSIKTCFSQCNIVVSNTNDAGAGSFRQAIIDANACATIPTITFTISSSSTIVLISDLPAITKANLTINGTTSTGFSYPNSMVTINWQNRNNCLLYNAGSSLNILKGLTFLDNYLGNGDAAIRVAGGNGLLINQCRAYNSHRNFVRVVGGTNILFRQNQCDNFNNDVLADAIEVNSGSLIEVTNSTFINIPRRIFEMDGTANGGTNSKVALRNNTITNAGYEDGSIGQKSSHIFSCYTDHNAIFSIKSNSVNTSSSKFIDLLNTNGRFDSTLPTFRDSIYANTVLNVKGVNTIYIEQYTGGLTYGGVIIYNNTLTGTGIGLDPIDQVILVKGWNGNNYLGAQIANNFITNYHGGAISCSYSDNLAIQDNLIYNCSNGELVKLINDCDNANIFNNFFGTDYNCVSGLSLSQGSTIELTDCDNCTIGGSRGTCKGNVIVASINNGSRKAINIAANCEGTTLVQGNYINVSKDQGECISTSSSQAVYVEGTIAGSKVTIGGDSLNMRNDICGGTNGTGIELNFQQTTAGNLIQGNLIGCRSTGCTINGNDLLYGIRIQGLTGSTTIGWGSGAVTSNLINKIGYCDEAIRNENRPNITWGGVLCWRNTNSIKVFNNNGASANGAIAPPIITSVNVTTGVITGNGAGGIVDVYLWDGPLSPQLGYSKQGYKFLGRATGSPWTLNLGASIPSGDIAAYQINGTSSSEWASYDVPAQGPFGNLNCITLNMPCWQAGGCLIPIPYAPTIGSIIQPTCSVSTGSINLLGLPTVNWTMTMTPGGSVINGSGTSYSYVGLNPGTYTFSVSIATGQCNSVISNDALILPIPGVPVIGAITQPTCSTSSGSVNISGLPALGNWTITATPGGSTVTGTGTSTSFGNLTPGNYTFVVTNGTCPSGTSQSVLINAAPIVPATPITTTNPASCSGNGTASISNFTAGQTYVFTPTGPTVSGGSISGLTPGTNYTVTAGNVSCTSSASSSFSIAAQLSVPVAPTTTTNPATCSGNGTASISNFTASQTYVFTPAGPTESTGSISGMTPGTNYTVTAGNGSCTSSASSSFSIAVQLSVPAIPITTTNPATCSGNGTASISNFTAGQTYVFTPTGPTVSGGSISGLTPGTNYTFTAGNVSCTSSASSSFSIAAQLSVPVAPTTTTTPATCSGNGTASISNFTAGQTYVFTPTGPTVSGGSISGLTPGTNYTFTAGNVSCTSSASSSFSIAAQLSVPVAPTTTTSPATCSANGTASISNFTAGQTYVFSPAGPTESTGSISGLTPGTNYTVTAGNVSCTSSASSSFSIAVQLSVPAIPITTTNPATCSGNGTASISNFAAGQTYVFTPTGPTVSGGSISGLTPGTNYTCTAGNGSCTSSASSSFSIAAQLSVPVAPTTTTTPATCSGNGTASISNFTAGQTYVFTPTGPTVSGGSISGLIPGTNYTFTAGNVSCTSSASSSFSISAQLPIPIISLTSTGPSTCNGTDGNILVSGSGNGDISWSGTSSGINASVTLNSNISNLGAGSYNVFYTSSSTGCQSLIVTTTLQNPNAPVLDVINNILTCNEPLILPIITGTNLNNPLYFTLPNGGGTTLMSGDTLTPPLSTTLYVYDANGSCSTDQSFQIQLNNLPVISISPTDPSACNATDGNILVTGSGNGILVWSGSTGDSIPSTTLNYTISNLAFGNFSIYFIDQVTGCQSLTMNTTLFNPNSPDITNPGNLIACDYYILPAIFGSNLSSTPSYWTQQGGTGIQFNAGDSIFNSITLYAYDQNGSCTVEEFFTITINRTPVIINPGNQTSCVNYFLPTINGLNLSGSEAFFNNSQSNGGLLIIDSITSSQTVYIFDSNGSCTAEEFFDVTIYELPTASISGGAIYCDGDVISNVVVDLYGTPNYTINYSIDSVQQSQIVSSSSSSISFGNTVGFYSITSLSDAYCTNNNLTSTQTIVINPTPNPPIAGSDKIYCKNDLPTDLFVQGTGIFTWYSDSTLLNTLTTGSTLTPTMNIGTTNYYVTETINNCESLFSKVVISVKDCDIIIPTAITPDNDGVNETWLLENIDQIYPINTVSIYNRWGLLIYQSNQGQYESNPWNGKFKNENLPVGSYYFVIEFNNVNSKNKNGIVSIIK